MTDSLNSPGWRDAISSLKRRVTAIERLLKDPAHKVRPDTTFSLAGPIYVSESTIYAPPVRRKYAEAVLLLGTALSSGTLTAVVKVNGSVIRTYEMPAGVEEIITPTTVVANVNDHVTVALTAVGSGGADFTFILRT